MNTEITLKLPEHIYQRAQRLAELTGQTVEAVLSATLGRSLPPLATEFDDAPLDSLLDEAVLALADSMMETSLSTRMSELLNKQQAGIITDDEAAELDLLMEVYDAGQLRKTRALVEAIKRGLRKPGYAHSSQG